LHPIEIIAHQFLLKGPVDWRYLLTVARRTIIFLELVSFVTVCQEANLSAIPFDSICGSAC
jgi:hypothetical protein